MDSVCLEKARFNANPPPSREPFKQWANPLVCMAQTHCLGGYRPLLRGSGASFYKMEDLDSKPLILHRPYPLLGGLQGLGGKRIF